MKKYCVIGEKLTHTMSPKIHMAYFDYYGKDDVYGAEQIAMSDMTGDCSDLLLQYDGFNVTVPYKEKIIKYLSGMAQEAMNIGAVNTVVNDGGKLYGYNSDPFGFEEMLKFGGIEIKDRTFVILGSGGASKSVQYILKLRGAKLIKIATRDTNKQGVDNFITYDELKEFKGDTLVNATPVGMYPNVDGSPVSDGIIDNFNSAVDIVYNPVYTKFLQNAIRLGKKAVGGLYMLVAQAMKSQEIWNNSVTDRALAKSIYDRLIKDYFSANGGNIYLTGIMACGKTSKGRRVAKALGWQFVDTDEYVEQISGKSISELFDEGESVFRDWESKAIAELSLKKNIVVATGGGAILRDVNVSAMKLSGVVVLIERNIEDIVARVRTDKRPLIAGDDGAKRLKAIYDKRKDRYYSTCDYVVKSYENDIRKTVGDILKTVK